MTRRRQVMQIIGKLSIGASPDTLDRYATAGQGVASASAMIPPT